MRLSEKHQKIRKNFLVLNDAILIFKEATLFKKMIENSIFTVIARR